MKSKTLINFTQWPKHTIAAGPGHSVGLKSDGTAIATGDDTYGQCSLSGWRNVVMVAAGNVRMATNTGNTHTVGLTSDGKVVAAGWNKDGQCNVSDWHGIVAIAAGSAHTIGLRSDGTMMAVGNNKYGQCDTYGWHGINLPGN